jgi:hypothetical protein
VRFKVVAGQLQGSMFLRDVGSAFEIDSAIT